MPSKNTKKKLKQVAQNKRTTKESLQKEAEVLQTTATIAAENNSAATVEGAEIAATEMTENQNNLTAKNTEGKETEKLDAVKTADGKDAKDAKKSKKSKKEGGKMKKKTKEVFSELKKVTWPTFGQVVKKTGTVLVVVLCFAVVLLGIDTVLELAYKWFIGGLNG